MGNGTAFVKTFIYNYFYMSIVTITGIGYNSGGAFNPTLSMNTNTIKKTKHKSSGVQTVLNFFTGTWKPTPQYLKYKQVNIPSKYKGAL
jgi:hypothetical protein